LYAFPGSELAALVLFLDSLFAATQLKFGPAGL